MTTHPDPVAAPSRPSGPGRQFLGAVVGAVLGGVVWVLLAVPQHLINVIFAVLVGLGAGVGAGRLSGAARSAVGVVVAVVTSAVVLLVSQAIVTRQYLSWATENASGAPAYPDWEGAVGTVRLVFDRASGRYGWTPNASWFWWTVALLLAGTLAWSTARPRPDRRVA